MSCELISAESQAQYQVASGSDHGVPEASPRKMARIEGDTSDTGSDIQDEVANYFNYSICFNDL